MARIVKATKKTLSKETSRSSLPKPKKGLPAGKVVKKSVKRGSKKSFDSDEEDDGEMGEDHAAEDLEMEDEEAPAAAVLDDEDDDDDAPEEVSLSAGKMKALEERKSKAVKDKMQRDEEKEKKKNWEARNKLQQGDKKQKEKVAAEAEAKIAAKDAKDAKDGLLPEDLLEDFAQKHKEKARLSRLEKAAGPAEGEKSKGRKKNKKKTMQPKNTPFRVVALNSSEFKQTPAISPAVINFKEQHLYGARVKRDEHRTLQTGKRRLASVMFSRS